MKPIIVPVNFSEYAVNAARYAADLALAIRAELYLVHVIQVPVASTEMPMAESLYKEMVDSAELNLESLKAELMKRTIQRVPVRCILKVGSVSGKIKDLCQELGPYAVVLGAAGTTLEKFLASSPAASLLHSLHYPVLVVPETGVFHHFRRILLACEPKDIGAGIPYSLPLLKDMRRCFGSRIDILTIETEATANEEPAVYPSEVWKGAFGEFHPELHYVRAARIEEGILQFLGHHEADLVMVFPKRHRLFEFHVSQSRKLTKRSPIPVMSIHA
ncbi:universal stress protein [Flavitalea sp. BT771]|uniref:universal stress protein n=1 Tax=Flavitalea sp. BT771 TaxID=3063329 RepID=UPI0026E3E15A|nr:universal stress protein [Flavitalea sp. BT771]MDO6432082.1 universal stress protein [Flavitalea sp. BT771]MDV6220991.1 universal stress protein [Flavitalea sp. BT771]